jgi:hypothetical protein
VARVDQGIQQWGDDAQDVLGVDLGEVGHAQQITLAGDTHEHRPNNAARRRASGASITSARSGIASWVMWSRSSSAASSLVMLARRSTAIGLLGLAAQARNMPRAKFSATREGSRRPRPLEWSSDRVAEELLLCPEVLDDRRLVHTTFGARDS